MFIILDCEVFSWNINQSSFFIHNRITYNNHLYYTIFEQFESSGSHQTKNMGGQLSTKLQIYLRFPIIKSIYAFYIATTG